MSSDPFRSLGEYLTAREADGLATLLHDGAHINQALKEVGAPRRDKAKRLLDAAVLGHADADRSAAVLRAIAGAKTATHRSLIPVWTMPGNEARIGQLTGEFHRLVAAACQSVTCATYNFETTSKMWTVLREASEQPGVTVTVYVDSTTGNPPAVRAQMPRASVYRSSLTHDGKPIKSHAKFVVVDHELVLLTSANFSFSAENRNIELGLQIQDAALAGSIEHAMASKHGSLYELVP